MVVFKKFDLVRLYDSNNWLSQRQRGEPDPNTNPIPSGTGCPRCEKMWVHFPHMGQLADLGSHMCLYSYNELFPYRPWSWTMSCNILVAIDWNLATILGIYVHYSPMVLSPGFKSFQYYHSRMKNTLYHLAPLLLLFEKKVIEVLSIISWCTTLEGKGKYFTVKKSSDGL